MLQILDADEEFLIGVRGNVLTIIWGRMTVERMRRLYAACEPQMERLAEKGLGSVNLIVPRRSEELPGVADERKKLQDLVEPHIIACAIIIEGDGMLATITRTNANAMQAARPVKYPQKILPSIEEGARWLVQLCAPRTGDPFTPADLAWDVSAARAQMRAFAVRD